MVGSKHEGVLRVMSFGISSSVMPTASFAAIFAIGKPGGLAGERGAARDARIHFDHGHAAGFGIDGELDVRAARLDADFANDRGGRVAHALIFLVGERLRGRDGDRIARVDAHRVDIFDRADHDEVVAEVAHHLKLEFFPADHGFFDQRLMNGARIERAGDGVRKFLVVVRDRAAGAAERERRANHDRVAELVREIDRFGNIGDDRRRGNFEADLAADVLEEQAIFGDLDRVAARADQLHAVLRENAAFGQLDGEVEARLAADGRQQARPGRSAAMMASRYSFASGSM